MAKIALPVKCSRCFEDVYAEVRVHQYETVVFVGGCSRCEGEVFKDGFDGGRDEGLEVGRVHGYEECEEKYKDDIRAAVKLTQDVCAESKGGDEKTRDSSS